MTGTKAREGGQDLREHNSQRRRVPYSTWNAGSPDTRDCSPQPWQLFAVVRPKDAGGELRSPAWHDIVIEPMASPRHG